MMDSHHPEFECSCQPFLSTDDERSYSCSSKPDPFSSEELEIFDQLRMLKDEMRDINRCLEEIKAAQNGQALSPQKLEEKQQYLERLQALRNEWTRLKKKREEAYIRRMIALGHHDPE